ncbi:Glutarate-semialdehyde dehydrogenase DavD [Nymphon striatum]|nr:Glutarate-semialdehyde dehydrogenase DavD [Nymphon striatum]
MDANAAGPGGLVAPKIWRDKPVGELAPAHAVLDVIEEEDLCARAMNFVRAAQRLERSVPQRPELSQSVPRFAQKNEAVELANDTEFGLAGYFYSKDVARVWVSPKTPGAGMVGHQHGFDLDGIAPFGAASNNWPRPRRLQVRTDDYPNSIHVLRRDPVRSSNFPLRIRNVWAAKPSPRRQFDVSGKPRTSSDGRGLATKSQWQTQLISRGFVSGSAKDAYVRVESSVHVRTIPSPGKGGIRYVSYGQP